MRADTGDYFMANELEWLRVRLEYLFPVLTVLLFASILAVFYVMSDVNIQAVVVEEEGTSGEQASAGVLNALVYIIPAVIGGFVIALLFKYGKKSPLRIFFGMAIFFATTFITWFFFNLILFVMELNTFGTVLIAPYSMQVTTGVSTGYMFYLLVQFSLPLSLFAGVFVAVVISSKRYIVSAKNQALLVLGGLMGAFLAVILPTWTVVFMLVLLSIYDIYSVRHGPIRDIMEYTYGPEPQPAQSIPPPPPPPAAKPATQSGGAMKGTAPAEIKVVSMSTQPRPSGAPDPYSADDDLLSNMTYSSANWDLGIGDLVFYSMLGSHTLMFGTRFISDFGLMAPLGLFGATTIGIILGFMITLRLLKKYPMLPGLPMSIFLGLAGFGLGVGFLYFL